MRYLAAFALIALAGWAFTRVVGMREARIERARLASQHDDDRLARQREAGTR